MKIAIMTQPLGKNYGGIMQAWALQQVLKKQGHEVVTIDRQSDGRGCLYHLLRLGYRSVQKGLGRRKAPINVEKYDTEIFQHTNSFVQQHLSMSEPLDSTEKLKAHFEREQYDAVIVGSDQTWRPMYSPNIGNFFLDFLEGKSIQRIAYASSFGVDGWEFNKKQEEYCKNLVKKFNAISVREASGVNLCRKYLGVDAIHVLDPTLLQKKNDYSLIFNEENIPSNEGVYTYILDDAVWKSDTVKFVSELLGKSSYSCQLEASLLGTKNCNVSDLVMPNVESWIKGFATADFVVTDSFHGTVFSIIFNKPFISLINKGRGSARFESLLSLFDLSKRLVSDFNGEDIKLIVKDEIDYLNVERRIEKLRFFSENFLINNLKGAFQAFPSELEAKDEMR